MFKLKLPTDPRWANIAEGNLEEILTDHAWCEQKAATNAIGLITMIPEHTEIVTELLAIAQEKAVEVTTSTTTTEEWYTNPLYWVIGAVALIAIIAIVSRSGNKD